MLYTEKTMGKLKAMNLQQCLYLRHVMNWV